MKHGEVVKPATVTEPVPPRLALSFKVVDPDPQGFPTKYAVTDPAYDPAGAPSRAPDPYCRLSLLLQMCRPTASVLTLYQHAGVKPVTL